MAYFIKLDVFVEHHSIESVLPNLCKLLMSNRYDSQTWLSDNIYNIYILIQSNQDVVKVRRNIFVCLNWCVCKIRTSRCMFRIFLFIHKNQMRIRWLVAIVVSIIVWMFTPAGLYVFTIPFLIWCMWWKKVRKFYFRFFFK